MLNNFPPLKRRKNDTHIIGNCLQCNDQQQQDGTCPHQSSSGQLASEFQQLRAATEDPTFDMEDIERRLRKLEMKLTSRLQEDSHTNELKSANDTIRQSSSNTNLTFDDTPPQPTTDQQQTEPAISLTSTGIHITTGMVESHHFVKLLLSGINPTFVQQKSSAVFTRHIDLAGPTYDNPNNNQGFSNLAIDKESPSEIRWFDMVLTTRYSMCFLVYQMVEKDRLAEWISQPFIDGLKGQVKIEHSLLAKSVRAFVYNHEKVSARHEHGGRLDDDGDPLYHSVNPNRGAFYFQQAQELLELCYMSSSRNTIRALLHMYMYQVMVPGGLVKAIQYSDLAIRMAQALKLDTEKGMLVNEQLREDDRRLWWSTVWVHLWSCTVLNRPFMVEKSAIMGPRGRVPSQRQDESSQVGYCIDFCVHSVKLILLSKSIGERLGVKTIETKLLWELQDIEHQLHTWSLALPEVLQPRFWSNRNRTPHSEHMDDMGRHDHAPIQSVHLFAVEIGLLLHGQWARIKMQLYECFWTNDGSILDLLVVRNRLLVALEFTNYLAQSIDQIRPCLLMYFLTTLEPSLTTLKELAAYQHNPDMVDQSIRQLYLLKTLLQAHPFTDDPTCQQWIHNIDQTLLQHTPHSLLQPGVVNNISTNLDQTTTLQNTGIITTNDSPSISYTEYLHDDEHTPQFEQHYQHVYHQPYLQPFIVHQESSDSIIQPTSFDPPPAAAPFMILGNDLIQQNQHLQQRQQQHEWTMAPRTTMLDELALYPIQKEASDLTPGRTFDGHQSSHHSSHHLSSSNTYVPNDMVFQNMATTPASSLPTRTTYLHHGTSITNNTNSSSRGIPGPLHVPQRDPTKMSSPHSTAKSLPLPRPPSYQHYRQQQSSSNDQEHRSIKSAGKQPSWSTAEIYPDSTSLDSDQHHFLSFSPTSTNQHGHHY